MRIASLGVSGGQAPVSLVPSHGPLQANRRSVSGQAPAHHRHSSGSDPSESPSFSQYARHSIGSRPLQAREAPDIYPNALGLSDDPPPPPTPGALSTASALAEPGSGLNSPIHTPLQANHRTAHSSLSTMDDEARAPRDDEARVEETRQALERFEAEETDPIARPTPLHNLPASSSSPTAHGAPLEPPVLSSEACSRSSSHPSVYASGEEHPTAGSTDSQEAYDGILDAYPSNSSVEGSMNGQDDGAGEGEAELELPMVKCADCGVPLSLMMLSEHVCSPVPATPAAALVPETVTSPRPVPADVPTDAHETSSNASEFEIHPILVETLSESEMDDLPEEIDPSEVEDHHQSEEVVVEEPRAQAHYHKPGPVLTSSTSASATLSPPPLSSRSDLVKASPRHSWDDDDEDVGCQTGYATIVRRSRG